MIRHRRAGLLGEGVDAGVRHLPEQVGDRLSQGTERSQGGGAVGRIAGVHGRDDEDRLADPRLGQERHRGREHRVGDGRQLIRSGVGRRRDAGDRRGRRGQDERTAIDHADGHGAIYEPCHDAEVPAATAHRPEQVGMLGGTGGDQASVGQHDLDRLEVVDRKSMLPGQVADPAAQGEAGDADRRRVAERDGQVVLGEGGCDDAGRQSGLGTDDAAVRVDVQLGHRAEVDEQDAVAARMASGAVAAAADGELEAADASVIDGCGDVLRAGGPDHGERTGVDGEVVTAARRLIPGVPGSEQFAVEGRGEGIEVEGIEVGGRC